jgi:repressor LexA
MDELTDKQQKILDFIRRNIESEGMPPTRAEIQAAFGFSSPNAAQEHLRNLAKRGAIELVEGASRGIRLAGQRIGHTAEDAGERLAEAVGLPLIGRVAAGSPILAEEHVERHVPMDPALFQPRADYLLKVRGMSMRDAGILDGDLLAVHRQQEARAGQIVVARVGDEVTVKRYQRRGHVVELRAENPEFKDIVVDTRNEPLAIEGLAVGLLRNGKGF